MEFTKLQGSGNDFILIDNREGKVYERLKEMNLGIKEFVKKVCARRTGVGADGLILIEKPADPSNDFRWEFFNADGSVAEMCGNGSRCAIRFCYEKGISGRSVRFETLAGIIKGEIKDEGRRVKVQLTKPSSSEVRILEIDGKRLEGFFINTGVPHFVVPVEDLDSVDVVDLGRKIRYHKGFEPKGTNVNFVEKEDDYSIKIRTYERGVEGETLACGTGATASAIVAYEKGMVKGKPVRVITRSGEVLYIHFDDELEEVFLEGSVYKVYEGILSFEIFLKSNKPIKGNMSIRSTESL